MNVGKFAVTRPVAVTMRIAALVLLGAVCLTKLPIDLLPRVTLPTVVVRTQWPNVAPEEIETQITRPIEQAVSSASNVYLISSSSTLGSSSVRVQFNYGVDIGQAAVDVLQLVERARPRLPNDPTLQAPTVFKLDPSQLPILIYGVSGIADAARLKALLEDLPEGFDLLALVSAVATSRPFRLEAPGLSCLTRTATATSKTLSGEEPRAAPTRRPSAAPAEGLCVEVLGGPEDGLQRSLTTSHPVLGRWDPQGARPDVCALFAHAGATDVTVSRRHLRWLRGAEIEALVPAGLRRDGVLLALRGATVVRVGDVLELGRGTRVEIVSVPG